MMAVSQALIERWQRKLAVGERLLASPHFRLRWRGQLYVRLYRFLLFTYGQEVSLDGPEDVAPAMPFEDHVSTLDGKPAKTLELIRSRLKAVHAANDHPLAPGDRVHGLLPGDRVCIHEFRRWDDANAAVRELKAHGMAGTVWEPRSKHVFLYVDHAASDEALAVIANWLARNREQVRPRIVAGVDNQLERRMRYVTGTLLAFLLTNVALFLFIWLSRWLSQS